MFFRMLASKPVKVANADGQTGNTTYWAFGYLGKQRIRKPLGTDRAGTGDTRVEWLKRAVEEGPSSNYWPQLRDGLPPRSFEFFAELVGYVEQPKPAEAPKPTWADLKAAYIQQLDRPIESGKRKGRLRTSSTKNRYLEVLRTFDRFLSVKNITLLSDITEKLVQEDFHDWRITDIKSKNNSRPSKDQNKLPGGFILDIAILCGVGKFAAARGLMPKSPFKYVGKPGADAENGAMEFSKKELGLLIKHAESDLLSLLVLLRTGLRRSDAIRLQWKHFSSTHVQIIAQKNGNRVRVPIQPDLAAALQAAIDDR